VLSFHSLKVTSVERAAQDAVCVTLAIPPALRESFHFDAGQYVTVRRMIDGREERRTYSIVTAPGSAALRLGVREQPGGRVSRDLATRVRPGDTLDVGTPVGRFRTAVDPARARSYVAFAAGSGITPVLSLATDILSREAGSRFTLIYGNRNMARAMFVEETLALKNRYLDRFSVHFVMSREPQQTEWLNGRIEAPKILELARRFVEIASADEYFVCGPGHMVDQVREAVKVLNPDAPVRFERFTAARGPGQPDEPPSIAAAQAAATQAAAAQAAGGIEAPAPQTLATITIVMDGRHRSFPMMAADGSVLEAAEHAGLALPFSCRSGICATCRARIVSGTAVMTHNIALEPWEIDAGFILCCQARPTSATLELSYDEK
jgi:ring-1,2-phenylacetyl-CoA epoxidase subunit PaaE